MSLLDSSYENFTVLNKIVTDDGYGGITTVWTAGATIKGIMTYDGSTQMLVAQAMGVTSAYKFIVKKTVLLDYHTVVRRESDQKIFRLTSNSDDLKTPNGAMNVRQYSAEEWKLSEQNTGT